MKHLVFIILLSIGFTACSSMEKFSPGDQTSKGIQFRKGSEKGVKVGDKIRAYKRYCGSANVGSKGCRFETIGFLTVTHTEDNSSILRKEGDFALSEDVYLEKDNDCPPRRTKSDPICM
tara:strand:+ start:59788 stop:60144 length:357 start_codon:yes stop_codon:yes gene_type:complete